MTDDSVSPEMIGRTPVVPGYFRFTQIGRGGFATVYRAHQVAFGRDVAIKVLDVGEVSDDARRRFERECMAVGALSSHPNIVTVFGAGTTEDGRPYIVMDLMEQGSLAERVRADGPLPAGDVVRIGLELIDAIGAAHEVGILHRDIKPDNVLISRYGRPQLADFGISSIPGGYETQSGSVTATMGFAAPEVINGERATVSSDLYSLAATLGNLVIGAPVFARAKDENLLAYIHRILRDPPRSLDGSGASAELAAVIARALAKDAADRYPHAAAFRTALAGVPEAESARAETVWRLPGAAAAAPTPIIDAVPVAAEASGLSAPVAAEPAAEPVEHPVAADDATTSRPVTDHADDATTSRPVTDHADDATTSRPVADDATTSRPVADDATTSRPVTPVADVAPVETPVPAETSESADTPAPVEATTFRPALAAVPVDSHELIDTAPATGRRRVVLIGAAAAVVVAGAGGGAALAFGGGSAGTHAATQPSTTTKPSTSVVALTVPEARVTCRGLSCTYGHPAAGAGAALLWTFGDGSPSVADHGTVSHRYAYPGTFTARLVASAGSNGDSRSRTLSITLHSWRRTLAVTAGGAGTFTVRAAASAPAQCSTTGYVLQRQNPSKKWVRVAAGRFTRRAAGFTVAKAATYRLLAAAVNVPNGICAAVVTKAVAVRSARYQAPTGSTPSYSAPTTSSGGGRTSAPAPAPVKYTPPPVKYTPPPVK